MILRGNFRFAPILYLSASLDAIDRMPQSTFDEIVEKYVEMNVAHPFREGNGRAGRIWLDHMLKTELGLVIDWSKVDKEDYLLAMERSLIDDKKIKELLVNSLVSESGDQNLLLIGIDQSWNYEGFSFVNCTDMYEIKYKGF